MSMCEELKSPTPDGGERHGALRLTPGQWRAILENRSFLDNGDNRFQHPRRYLGAPVQIIPDESFR